MKRAMAAAGLNPKIWQWKATANLMRLRNSETMLRVCCQSRYTTEQAKAQFAHMESVEMKKGFLYWYGGIIPTNTFFSSTSLLNGRRSI